MDVDLSNPRGLSRLLEFYEKHLHNEVMPFWLNHCIDREFGGITNCITDDGVLVSTNKYVWSQARALWTFSSLYNDFDQDERWLEVAHNIAQFLLKYGRDKNGDWAFCLKQDGSMETPSQSVYVDAFIIHGLTEYARATRSTQAIEIALQTYERLPSLLTNHSSLKTAPHHIPPGLQSHGPLMIFANAFYDLGSFTKNDKILSHALELAEKIMTEHVKPDQRILREYVRPGGEIDTSDAGKTFLPGHAIESMWFLQRIYQHFKNQKRIDQTLDVILWNLEKGWDEEFGGLFLACHLEGEAPQWHQPDAKVWWPHTESLYALIKAYEICGESWCSDWYRCMHDFSFSNYPNKTHGDWHQNLDRKLNRIQPVAKGLQVKDPFHLPRALIYSINALRKLSSHAHSLNTSPLEIRC
jgi:N-acylglucosamine 2-epimerase